MSLKVLSLTIVTLEVRASTHEFGSGGHSLVHYTPYTLKMVPDVSHLTLQIPSPFLSTCSMLRDTDLCVFFRLAGALATDRAWLVRYTGKKWERDRRRLGLSMYSPGPLPVEPKWVGVSLDQFSIRISSSVSSTSDAPLPSS